MGVSPSHDSRLLKSKLMAEHFKCLFDDYEYSMPILGRKYIPDEN